MTASVLAGVTAVTASELAQRVVYRDAELVVVDKPPGIISAGPDKDGRRSVESILVELLGRPQVWAIHQLDRETSGLNLFALKKSAVAPWAERLKRDGAKRYLAVTHGVPPLGEIVAAVGERIDPGSGKTFPGIVPSDHPSARAATSIVVAVHPNAAQSAARVEIRPLTGRTHQVRLHLAHVGCPVFGEKLHREPPCAEHPRHALHAWRLVFADRSFEAPLAADLVTLCDRLGVC